MDEKLATVVADAETVRFRVRANTAILAPLETGVRTSYAATLSSTTVQSKRVCATQDRELQRVTTTSQYFRAVSRRTREVKRSGRGTLGTFIRPPLCHYAASIRYGDVFLSFFFLSRIKSHRPLTCDEI